MVRSPPGRILVGNSDQLARVLAALKRNPGGMFAMNHPLAFRLAQIIVVLSTCSALVLLRFIEISHEKFASGPLCMAQSMTPSLVLPAGFDTAGEMRWDQTSSPALLGVDSKSEKRATCQRDASLLHLARRAMGVVRQGESAQGSVVHQTYVLESSHTP